MTGKVQLRFFKKQLKKRAVPAHRKSLRSPVFRGVEALGQRGHDWVIVQNNPINYTDPTGLIANNGFISQLAKMANKSLLKTIKSLLKQIEKHEKSLADECQKQAKQHHEHELRLFREQLSLAEQEAAKRGLMGAGFAEAISEDEAGSRINSWFDWIDPFLFPGTAY